MTARHLGNAFANFAGGALPALVTIATIPFVVKHLGTDAYGVLVLVTSIMGYFALLDVNVTAGSVKYVAEFHAQGRMRQVRQVITFGLWIYLGIGVAGLVGLLLSARQFSEVVFKIPAPLIEEATLALRWTALGFLVGQLQAYLQSIPQALHRFDLTGRFEASFGVVVPVLTVLVLAMGFGLVEVVMLRVAASGLHALLLLRTLHQLLPDFHLERPDAAVRQGVIHFSAYAFLSRLAMLTYAHADKLLIGAIVGMQALAWYAVATTVVNRIMALTGRLAGVIFPAASAMAARAEMREIRALYLQSSRYLFFLNGAVVMLLACFAHDLLEVWMGPEFARAGSWVLALVALGTLVDSLTNVPSLVNDGLGHPRVSGLFAVSRALLGLGLLYVGIQGWGVLGAAWAHLAASAIMTTAFLAYVHERTVPVTLQDLLRQALAGPLLGLLGAATATGLILRALDQATAWVTLMTGGLLCTVILSGVGWWLVLSGPHRAAIVARVRGQS